MSKLKRLAQDTAIYGVGSIVPKILNWFLVPFYTRIFNDTADYGIITNLYAWVAILLVILTYGMETGFFRFANSEKDPEKVYSTSLLSIAFTSLIFVIGIFLSGNQLSHFLKIPAHPDYIFILGSIVAFDAFSAIPFARLRYDKRPLKFAFVRISMIAINILANIFFLVICPALYKSHPTLISWFYNPNYLVGYVFVANAISTFSGIIFLMPEILKAKFQFDWHICKRILSYCWPLLIVGVAGIFNQSGDKILYPYLVKNAELAKEQLGVYGANYKIAVIMVMFTQAFRYSFEPFIFSQKKDKDSKLLYAQAMHWFTIIGLLVFVGVTLFIDIVKYFIDKDYHDGLYIVPIVLLANLFLGMFFSLSVWYKLTDKTIYGAILAVFGSIITVIINILLVPKFGFLACALANLICYFSILVFSYLWSRKVYQIPYNLAKMGFYFLVAFSLFGANYYLPEINTFVSYLIKTLLVSVFVIVILFKEEQLRAYIFKLLRLK